MITIQHILAEVEAFLRETGMPPTRFGLEVDKDRTLVIRLRQGRSVTLAKAERIMEYIRKHKPARKPRKGQRRTASAVSLVA